MVSSSIMTLVVNLLYLLQDHKERKLEFDDILHYQKIIVALAETDRIMKEVNKIDFMGE